MSKATRAPNGIDITLSTAISESGDTLFNSGSPTGPADIAEKLEWIMALIRTTQSQKLAVCDFTWGLLHGAANALAWVLGNEWLSELAHPMHDARGDRTAKTLRHLAWELDERLQWKSMHYSLSRLNSDNISKEVQKLTAALAESMRQIKEAYGRDCLDCDMFEFGTLEGEYEAIEWVLGGEGDASSDLTH